MRYVFAQLRRTKGEGRFFDLGMGLGERIAPRYARAEMDWQLCTQWLVLCR